jgi:hypothetical protein
MEKQQQQHNNNNNNNNNKTISMELHRVGSRYPTFQASGGAESLGLLQEERRKIKHSPLPQVWHQQSLAPKDKQQQQQRSTTNSRRDAGHTSKKWKEEV